MTYPESNDLLTPVQFGFRRYQNTKHVVHVVRHIHESFNMGNYVASIFLDVPKASILKTELHCLKSLNFMV